MYFPPNFIVDPNSGGKPMPPPHHMTHFLPYEYTLTPPQPLHPPPPHHMTHFFPFQPPHHIGLPQHPSFEGFPPNAFSILSSSNGISSSGFMNNNGNHSNNNSGFQPQHHQPPQPQTPQSHQTKQQNETPPPTLFEIFDDLSSRFVINIPQEELETFERLLFQIEAAHWFYDDFYREEHPELPKYNLSEFTKVFFNHCPLLQPHQNSVEEICKKFSEYKTRVPVFGCIILNENLDKALFVKGFGSCTWGFPKGKVNKDEPDHDCAIREVYEETGFDCTNYLNQRHYIEIYIKEQKTKLYIVAGVPEETVFKTRTRKEISKIEWIAIDDLPSLPTKKLTTGVIGSGSNATTNPNSGYRDKNFYRAFPFFQKLKRWIVNRKAKYTKEGYMTTPHNEGNTNNNNNTSINTPNSQIQSQTPNSNNSSINTPNNNINSNQIQTPKPNSTPNLNVNNSNSSNNSLNKINYSPYPMSPPVSPREANTNNSTHKVITPTIILRNPNSISQQIQNIKPQINNNNNSNVSIIMNTNNSTELPVNLTTIFTNQMKQFGIQVDEPTPIDDGVYPTTSDEQEELIFKMKPFDINELSNCFNHQQS